MRRHLCFYPIALPRKPCSKHMLHCSYCYPSQSFHHVMQGVRGSLKSLTFNLFICRNPVMCSVSTQEIARHLRPATLRALYGKNKVQNAIHCTDLPEDGILEVSSSKSHSNVMQEPHSHVLYSVSFWGSSPSKIFLDPTNAYEAQNKMASRSHDCPQWAEADPQPGSQEGKQVGRVGLVEGEKKAIVMPRSGFGQWTSLLCTTPDLFSLLAQMAPC